MARAETLSKRHPPGDLAILSAEVYDAGLPFSSSGRRTSTRKAKAPRDSEDGPRKRQRTQATDASEPEDEKKRSRGRPRLDPKDETAADRRRTQIRLAQRAYRNRKENAIQELEKQVQQLKETNEEMSNAFMQLHDFALSSGLLESNPEFGTQLRATTEKFLALARKASEDDAKDHEPGHSPRSNPSDSTAHSDQPDPDLPSQGSGEATAATTPEADPKTQPLLYAGLTITHELATPAFSTTLSSLTSQPTLTPTVTPTYEILTHPTPTNASFPLPLPPPSNLNLNLPLPSTFSTLETTFGRQLQRYILERALFLITLPSAPEALINRIFGFCLLIESRDDIRHRITAALGHTSHQSLYYWGFPFYHLGGAGTHRDLSADDDWDGRRVGNQGTEAVQKPRDTAGFAEGPFGAVVNAVRDGRLGIGMRIDVPGFEGEYLDCDEAEVYLCQRGVVIPPGADFVTAEVDVREFGGDEAVVGQWLAASEMDYAAMGGGVQGQGTLSASLSPELGMDSGAGLANLSETDVSAAAPWLVDDAAGLPDPILMDGGFSQPSMSAYLPSESVVPEGGGTSGVSMSMTAQGPKRQRVVVDVNALLEELTTRTICLGRTPGLKRSGINKAFWAAVRSASVM